MDEFGLKGTLQTLEQGGVDVRLPRTRLGQTYEHEGFLREEFWGRRKGVGSGSESTPFAFCLGDGAITEVGGGGTVVGTEGEAVVLNEGGLVNRGADEAPEMDGLARPFRYRECDFAYRAFYYGHLALTLLRTVGGDIDGVLTKGSCRDVYTRSECYLDARRLHERGGGELH